MREEKLRLVTDFAELRTGMIVVCMGCTGCGGTHRGILAAFGLPPGDEHRGPSWEVLPSAHRRSWVDQLAVASRVVFRVIDDEVTQVSRTAKRKREGVR